MVSKSSFLLLFGVNDCFNSTNKKQNNEGGEFNIGVLTAFKYIQVDNNWATLS